MCVKNSRINVPPTWSRLKASDNNTNNKTILQRSTQLLCMYFLFRSPISQVSWVRRRYGISNLDLLTVGKNVYSGDPRYKVEFQYPSNWRLKIESATKDDEGTYECQISTHPPRVIQKNLHVNGKEMFCKYCVNNKNRISHNVQSHSHINNTSISRVYCVYFVVCSTWAEARKRGLFFFLFFRLCSYYYYYRMRLWVLVGEFKIR